MWFALLCLHNTLFLILIWTKNFVVAPCCSIAYLRNVDDAHVLSAKLRSYFFYISYIKINIYCYHRWKNDLRWSHYVLSRSVIIPTRWYPILDSSCFCAVVYLNAPSTITLKFVIRMSVEFTASQNLYVWQRPTARSCSSIDVVSAVKGSIVWYYII